ncbi:MAG: exodeoxyribonuclease I [Candidatus Saccharimonadales bacterium]
MADSFFFYDLETSGISSSLDRIMQFAGQRTDLQLQPIGKPINLYIKLTADVLPSPSAILLSGISPKVVNKSGVTEAEFSAMFNTDIAQPGTIFTGFNNIRFDDEFIRYLNYRNFFDAYSWHWVDSSSRWDILDVVRMTRALRPEGINWPFTEDNKPTNKLELLTKLNNLKHKNAHHALSDALATLEIAKLIKSRQPKLFQYLLTIRHKAAVIKLLKDNDALVYTSSHYPSEFLHTTVVSVLNLDESMGSALVFDLREDVRNFLNLSIDELTDLWSYDPEKKRSLLPVKTMKLNRCPAVAPLTVLDQPSLKRLSLDMSVIENNRQALNSYKDEFSLKLQKVTKRLDNEREKRRKSPARIPSVDEQLYDKFVTRVDSQEFKTARAKAKLTKDFEMDFKDRRLNMLYGFYRARNYPEVLTKNELAGWKKYVRSRLLDGKPSKYEQFLEEVALLTSQNANDTSRLKLLSDLKKYAKTILSAYENDLPV